MNITTGTLPAFVKGSHETPRGSSNGRRIFHADAARRSERLIEVSGSTPDCVAAMQGFDPTWRDVH